MTDQISIVNFTTPGTTGNFDVTSSSITDTVQAVIFLWNYDTADASTDDNGIHGMSFVADDGTQLSAEVTHAITLRALDNKTATTDICDSFKSTGPGTKTLIACPIVGTSTALDIICNYVGMISGGIRLNAATVTGGATTKCTAIIIAGTSRAYSSQIATTTSSAHEDVGSGANRFQADLIIFSGDDGAYGAPTRSNRLVMNTGFAISGSQVGATSGWASASPTDGDGEVTTATIATMDTSRGQARVTIGIDSTGFNHQLTTGAGSPDMMYLAIKFASAHRFKVGNFAIPASSGDLTLATGFPVSFAFGHSSLFSATDTFTDGAEPSGAGRFVWTPSTARAWSICQKENVTLSPAATDTAMRQDSLAALTLDQNKAVAHSATFKSNGNSGPVLTFSTANAGFLTGIFIGPVEQDETISVSETSQLVFSSIQVAETISITESSKVAISAFQANETVSISEGAAFVGSSIFGETVTITESFLLLRTSGTAITADRRGGTTQALAIEGGTVEAWAELGTTAG